MTADLLLHLADRYTFDASPSFADLGAYHVPFDELVGGKRVEHRLAQAVSRGERVALIAHSGAGKSTVISSVLGQHDAGLAPIVVPVRPLEDRASSPARVADEMLALLGRYANQVSAASVAGNVRTVMNRRRHSGGVRLALGWLQGDLAQEITRQTQTEQPISLREKSELLAQTLRRIQADGLMPVIVFDDTDRWFGDASADIVTGFFRDIVRWLTDLPVAVVVAAHRHYLEPADLRRDRLEFLDTEIELPRLKDVNGLTKLLDRRISLNVYETAFTGATCKDVFVDGAIDSLFVAYDDVRSLRRVIQIVHAALAEATSAGSDAISEANIRTVYELL